MAVADDTADMRLLLQMAIEERAELEWVGEAADGEQAIDLVAALHPDVLILDIDMPVLTGLDALPRLAQVAPQTRVVIVSALPIETNGAIALNAGALAYVVKRPAMADLIDEVLTGADLIETVKGSLSASATLALGRDLGSPAEARRFVAATLDTWRQSELADTVQLLLCELVTNVIVHTAGTPDVRVSLLADRVHVEVADADPAPIAARRASAEATSGRGLQFVTALASDWGTVRLGDRKVVWFDVPRPGREPR